LIHVDTYLSMWCTDVVICSLELPYWAMFGRSKRQAFFCFGFQLYMNFPTS